MNLSNGSQIIKKLEILIIQSICNNSNHYQSTICFKLIRSSTKIKKFDIYEIMF